MRSEFRAMLRLAVPVIVAELGWISMGLVDTIMVGPLGPAALGAVGTGSTIFFALMVLGMGVLLSLDTFVSQSFGAGRLDECHRWLLAGCQLAVVLSVGLVIVAVAGLSLLPRAGLVPEVLHLLDPYLATLLWSVPPLMVYTVLRRYLQALHVVRPIAFALVTANLLNAAANWTFVYGKFGLPALGVVGSAYATIAARVYLAVVLAAVLIRRERRRPSGFREVPFVVEMARMRALVAVGGPAALQVMLEVGVFATAGALAARITPVALAANQIVLNIAGFFFMIPYGLGSAAAVRVGHAIGCGDRAEARRAGWTALGLATLFALLVAVLFVFVPGVFIDLFTRDADVRRMSATVLLVYAAALPFDGWQTVATGALRGLGETRLPMLVNLVGHWALGLPVAWFLCFDRGWNVMGLWAGLSIGLVVIGITLVIVWQRQRLSEEGSDRPQIRKRRLA